MGKSTYRYNPETCQYERVEVRPRDIVFYSCGLLLLSLVMLSGMLILHDFVIDSEKELALRKENNALENNRVLLNGQLRVIEASLATLRSEDERLHTKFFGSPQENVSAGNIGQAEQRVLLADAAAFRRAVKTLDRHSTALLQQSWATNAFFGEHNQLNKSSIDLLHSIPTLQPVQPWSSDKLLSGFGTRIHPFHKGNYEHSGVDIAMPRGSVVVATAPGSVILVKRSELEAGYGNYIEIDHGHGFVTRYAHLEEIHVRSGQRVRKGNAVGTIGNSGGSIAPHLHYEIIRNGKNVNPVHYMIESLGSDEHHRMILLSEKQNQSLD
jgi:murein DD-endopeptidase MepM/ murein hydrolase activator NlpD